MKMIFFIHDGLRRNLFLSLSKKSIEKKNDVQIYCFSLEEYLWFVIRGMGSVTYLVKEGKGIYASDDLVENSIDVCAGFLNTRAAQQIYSATYTILKNIEINFDAIVYGGNGLHAYDKAILEFERVNKNIKPLFTELSNIDGKLFVDRKGSNASSEYYELLSTGMRLDKPTEYIDMAEWKETYINKKKNKHTVKQAPEKKRLKLVMHRLFGLAELLFRLPSYQRFKISEYFFSSKKTIHKIYSEDWAKHFDKVSDINSFVFFPMQVFGDSQIKLHSKIDNETAIEQACLEAKKCNLPLIVKPHPAEFDIHALNTVLRLKKKYGFYLSDDNTFQLIINSSKVIVINSTVGLEAIICGKEVDFLGDSFYRYLKDENEFQFYINNWLIDYDIFSCKETTLTDEQFNKFLMRAGVISSS